MDDFNELVRRYAIKHDRKIGKICAPLQEIGIPIFSYLRIEPDGRFGNLNNFPEQLDFYYAEKFYADNPFFVHPNLLRPGHVFTTCVFTPFDSEKMLRSFQVLHVFLILIRNQDSIEVFLFNRTEMNSNDVIDFYPKLEMLYQFTRYFKREAKALIEQMMSDGFNLKQARGDAFFRIDPRLPLSNNDPNMLKFLKTVDPLSHQERKCLNLFKQGHSAQATAAILNLSKRTVEHYFDNIKNKLGCSSKWELLDY